MGKLRSWGRRVLEELLGELELSSTSIFNEIRMPKQKRVDFLLLLSNQTNICQSLWRIIVDIMTANKSLTGHMFRIGIIQHDTYSSCNKEAVSTEHLLCPSGIKFLMLMSG